MGAVGRGASPRRVMVRAGPNWVCIDTTAPWEQTVPDWRWKWNAVMADSRSPRQGEAGREQGGCCREGHPSHPLSTTDYS